MCINKIVIVYNFLSGTFKPSYQIEFEVNIFHTHLLGGE